MQKFLSVNYFNAFINVLLRNWDDKKGLHQNNKLVFLFPALSSTHS